MKQLFSYYDDGEKHVYEGEAFRTRSIDAEKAKRLRELEGKLAATLVDESEKLPILTPLNYALLACGMLIIAMMIYMTSTFGSLDGALEKSPLFIGAFVAVCVVAAVLVVIDKKKRRTNEPKPEKDGFTALADEQHALTLEALDELGIPTDEEGLDVITVSDLEDLDTLTVFDSLYLALYVEGDTVVLTDYCDRYDIPKSDFKAVTHIERAITLRDAVKPFFKELRREYNVKETDEGFLVPAYDLFTLEKNGESYALALPVYDGKKLSSIVGLN